MRYRLNRPLMVLAQGDNHQAAVPIAAGTIVEASPSKDDRFAVIRAEGQEFLAFRTDLEIQAEPVPSQRLAAKH